MPVLVTGGAGYIGSHAVQRLLRDGRRVVVLDNLFRGHKAAIDLLARDAGDRLAFVEGDTGNRELVGAVLDEHDIDTIMHFAALTYVGESVQQPLRYYLNNTASSTNLLDVAAEHGVERFVFSSTAATYGEPSQEHIPIRENCPKQPINPYGQSKLMFERVLEDHAAQCRTAGKPFAFAALRYFNVAGADRSGLLGEDHDPETHLIPVALEAALGKRDKLTIFGTDYPTPDGSCVRDYVHVEDLIDAHVAVMDALEPGDARAYNLGIGRGYSVREVIDSVDRVTGKPLNVTEGDRRPGDPPTLYADPAKIKSELGWKARITDLDEIVSSAWEWFQKHPNGYGT